MATTKADDEIPTQVCSRAVTIDTDLLIRHGSALTERNMRWIVTNQIVDEPLLGRPLLEALGLNTREILAAAADKHHGQVDVSTLCQQYIDLQPDGRIARVLEGFFHADGGFDDSDLDEDDG